MNDAEEDQERSPSVEELWERATDSRGTSRCDFPERLDAVDLLLWMQPGLGMEALVAMAGDVDIEDDERLAVLSLAVEAGPATQFAAGWVCERIRYAYLEGSYRQRAAEMLWGVAVDPRWRTSAYALVVRTPCFSSELRADAASEMLSLDGSTAVYRWLLKQFPLDRLPGALHDVSELGSTAAADFLTAIARDQEVAAAVRVDAAEWLTVGEPSDGLGEQFLLDVLQDESAPITDRTRALKWLDASADCRQNLEKSAQEKYGITSQEAASQVRNMLTTYYMGLLVNPHPAEGGTEGCASHL